MVRRHSIAELVEGRWRPGWSGGTEIGRGRCGPASPHRGRAGRLARLADVCLEERNLLMPWLQALWDGLDGSIDAGLSTRTSMSL